MIFNAKGSCLYYKDHVDVVDDYYQNIVKLIKLIIANNPSLNVNIAICNNTFNFNNTNKTVNIKIKGRSIPSGTPVGNIDDGDNSKYLVRIDQFDNLNNSDIVIDYSIPNIHNVKTCAKYNSFSKKHVYISSSIYEPYFDKANRNIITLTTFINTKEPRRAVLLNKLITHTNIHNCFDKSELQNILKNTKILINIHQTPHHHTFEELRILPALECGVIVISEKSPLNELIPYNNLIVWADYDDIIEKTKEVKENYDFFHNTIFSKENMTLLSELKQKNYEVLQHAIVIHN
jgi:hypothetical protein